MVQTEAPSFGTLLRRHRHSAGLTQEELAERAGLSVRGISDLERDVKQRPHRDTVELLAGALQLQRDDRAAFEQAGRGGKPPAPAPLDQVASVRARSANLPGGFLGARPAGPLVGREAERSRLLEMIDAAAQGIGRLVMIAGEPGAGKTRLGQELTLDLEAEGFLVSTGRCFERQESIPFAPLLDALPSLYAEAPIHLRRSAAEQWPYLAPLLPDDLPAIPGASADPGGDQLRVFRALTRFLVALTAERPVALLFDDLQWADAASLDLWRHLAVHTREAPIFLAGIHRLVPRRHRLRSALRDLAHDGLLDQIAVRRLDRAGTAALLAVRLTEATVAEPLVDVIHSRAEGNAFFTMEILRALTERGDIGLQGDTWALRGGAEIAVPENVRLAIDERVGRLPESVQTLLGQASILGHTFTADELGAMSERGAEEVEDGLEAATEAELLQERREDAYAFSHVLVQQTLYEDLSGTRRRRLHLAAGRALETMPERGRRPPAELAWHLREGGDAERAFHWTVLAGDQAEAGFAHAEAEAQYRLALELAEQIGVLQAEAAAREKLAAVLTNLGRTDDAIKEADTAILLYRQTGDLEGEGRTAGHRTLYGLGGPARHARIRALLEALRPQLEARGPSSTLAALYFSLGVLLKDYESWEQGLELAARGSEIARSVGDRTSLFLCEILRGHILYRLDRGGEAVVALTELVDTEGGDRVPLEIQAETLLHLGTALANQGELAAGIHHTERALALAEQEDAPVTIQTMLNVLVLMEFLAGNWNAARGYAQRVAAIADQIPREGWNLGFGKICLGKIALCQGSIEEGERHLLEALERLSDELHWVSGAAAGLADQDLFAGRAEDALRRLAPLPRSDWFEAPYHLDVLARAHLASGNSVEAATILTEWIKHCRTGDRAQYIDALWSVGMVEAASERRAEADAAFGEAVALARQMPYPYGEARALYHWGLELVRWHRGVEARERLEGALAIFQTLGAMPYAERTQQALAALGA